MENWMETKIVYNWLCLLAFSILQMDRMKDCSWIVLSLELFGEPCHFLSLPPNLSLVCHVCTSLFLEWCLQRWCLFLSLLLDKNCTRDWLESPGLSKFFCTFKILSSKAFSDVLCSYTILKPLPRLLKNAMALIDLFFSHILLSACLWCWFL